VASRPSSGSTRPSGSFSGSKTSANAWRPAAAQQRSPHS
jgi:hypothetical protein